MRGISVLLSRITIRFSAVLSAVPIRQPFGLSARNIGIIETPGAVDAAADVVDICGNPADGSSQLFLLIQADFFADGSCAVWYDKTLLSLLNGHFLLKTW